MTLLHLSFPIPLKKTLTRGWSRRERSLSRHGCRQDQSALRRNVFGVVRVTQAFSPLLVHTANTDAYGAKRGQGQTTVVNIGSLATALPTWCAAYASSKVSRYTSRRPLLFALLAPFSSLPSSL